VHVLQLQIGSIQRSMRWSTYHTASDWLCSSRGGAAILKVEGTKSDSRASTFPNVGVGYKQANNQYWIQWNVLCGCRINKYVIGLYYTNINQRRRKLQHWTKSTKILIVHTVHVTCDWIMLRCALCTETFWTSLNDIKKLMQEFVLRKHNRGSVFGKIF